MEIKKNSKGVIAVLVVIIVILLALVVLIGTGTVSFKSSTSTNNQQNSENNIVDNEQSNTINETNDIDNNANSSSNVVSQKSSVSKSQILSYYKERIYAFSDSNHQYSVIDINNDDIPELFIYVTGTLGNQIIADTSVFTYDENKGDK